MELSDDEASGLVSYYADGKIYRTRTGVRPEEDWGELQFSCARMDDGIPWEIANLYRGDIPKQKMRTDNLANVQNRETRCFLARFEYEEILVACVILILSPSEEVGGVAIAHNIAVSRHNCPRCHLPNLQSLLLSAAARELKVAYLFAARWYEMEEAEPLGLDPACAARFDVRRGSADSSIFSPDPLSPHHPWLSFGPQLEMAYNERSVITRDCAIIPPGGGDPFRFGRVVFHSDNSPYTDLYLLTEPRYNSKLGKWRRKRGDEWFTCDPPNYAEYAPNMFLTRFLEDTMQSILYIIDCKKLPRQPRALTHPNVGLAIAMSMHPRLGNG